MPSLHGVWTSNYLTNLKKKKEINKNQQTNQQTRKPCSAPLIILRVTQVTVLTGVSSKETLNVHFSHLVLSAELVFICKAHYNYSA